MTTFSLFNFFVRCLLLLVLMLCRQLPSSYDIHVDTKAFLNSFQANVNGELVRPSPWELRPSGAVHQTPDEASMREMARRMYLEKLRPYMAKAIPHVFQMDDEDKERSKRVRHSTYYNLT